MNHLRSVRTAVMAAIVMLMVMSTAVSGAGRATLSDRAAAAAEANADIRVTLESAGTPIGNMDLMTAAHARSAGAVLVTNNEKHFRRVEGLKVENWA